jgi:hypothetical protein
LGVREIPNLRRSLAYLPFLIVKTVITKIPRKKRNLIQRLKLVNESKDSKYMAV